MNQAAIASDFIIRVLPLCCRHGAFRPIFRIGFDAVTHRLQESAQRRRPWRHSRFPMVRDADHRSLSGLVLRDAAAFAGSLRSRANVPIGPYEFESDREALE